MLSIELSMKLVADGEEEQSKCVVSIPGSVMDANDAGHLANTVETAFEVGPETERLVAKLAERLTSSLQRDAADDNVPNKDERQETEGQ